MKTDWQRLCALLALFALLTSSFARPALAAQSSSESGPSFERTFTEKLSSLSVENPGGRTEIQTWGSSRVRVVASRAGGSVGTLPLDVRVRFEKTSPEALRIFMRRARIDDPVQLTIYVPRSINLYARGGSAPVIISGATDALSVETDTGSISLHLPAMANTDLSLRAIEGTITSKLALTNFGTATEHSLDARTGIGGSPVILRSARGAIDLSPDDPARLAQINRLMVDDMNTATEPRIIKSSQDVSAESEAGSTESAETKTLAANQKDATGDAPPVMASSANRNDAPVDEVVKIDTRMVNLNVRVTDTAGKLIPDLSREDFQIFENNIEQEVVHFEPVTAPVNVILLLDLSGSTKDKWKTIKKSAKKFIDSLSPTTRISVAAFTRRFMLVSDFTDNRKLLKDRIDDMKNFGSGTAFYDSMWSALDLFKPMQEKRKAVVVMTDGVDNSIASERFEARHPFDELLSRITQDDVTVYPIYFDTEYEVTFKMRSGDTHEAYVTAREQLQRMADDTGGTLFKATRAEDLEGVYGRVASELQTLYSVAYNPKDKSYDGKWRNLTVRVKRPQAMARTKRGFYAK